MSNEQITIESYIGIYKKKVKFDIAYFTRGLESPNFLFDLKGLILHELLSCCNWIVKEQPVRPLTRKNNN